VRVLALALALAGCYAPTENKPCSVRCGDGDACPDGLHCLDHFCAPPGTVVGQCVEPCSVRCGDGSPCDDGLPCLDHFCAPRGTVAGQCCPAPEADDLYVDNVHIGFSNGSAACPFASITAALHAAAPGATLHVAAGTYASPAEHFPIDLRGFSLEGAGMGQTILDGSATYDHYADGGLLRRYEQSPLWVMSLLIGDPARATRLEGVTITDSHFPPAPAHVLGLVCDAGDVPATGAVPDPNTIVDGVDVEGAYEAGVVITNRDDTACNLRMTGSRVAGAHEGVWQAAYTDAIALPWVAFELGDGSAAGGNQFVLIEDPIPCGGAVWTLTCDHTGAGVYLGAGARRAIVRGNYFADSDGGLLGVPYGPLPELVVVDDNTFTELGYGIELHFSSTIHELHGNTITSCQRAMNLYDASTVRARNNVVVGNLTGVYVNGGTVGGWPPTRFVDFGLPDDPGGNVLRCNSDLVASGSGWDVGFAVDASADGRLWFYGNVWDQAPVIPTTDANRHNGDDVVDENHPPEAVMVLGGATTSSDPCPTGHMP
jgi:hypothetical protein